MEQTTTEYSYQYDLSYRGEKIYGYSEDTSASEFNEAKNQGDILSCANCEDWFAGKSDQTVCFRCLGHKKG